MSSSSVSLGRNLVSLKWEDFNMFVVSELSALYQKDDLTDVTLFCEGRSFRAHKVLLSLWSSYFRDIFRSTSHSHPVVILKETNSSDLELILRFIYQGHLLIPIEETDRFLKTAEHFQVAGLKNMRNHVPNFNYSSTSSGSSSNIASSFHDENSSPQQHQQQQQQQQHVHSAYDNGVQVVSGGASLNTTGSSSQHHQQQSQSNQHFNRASNSGGGGSTPVLPPHPPPHSVLPTSAESPSHHQSPVVEASNHQQVIRQGSSSRPPKHIPVNLPPPPPSGGYSNPSPVSFQQTSAGTSVTPTGSNGGGGNVGVVTRVGNESVIYQPQPVLIFQNGLPPSGGVPILKGEPQYITRSVSGEGGRQEHSMMVIEGVISDTSVHLEPSTSHTTVGAPYTVYAHSSNSPAPNPPPHSSSHHSSPEVGSNDEAILGLPYNPPPTHSLHREIVNEDPPPTITSQTSHHHSHVQAQHISHHHHSHLPPADSHSMDMDTSSVVNHPYTPSSASYESPIPNGNSSASSSSSNSSLPSSSKIKSSSMSINNPDPPPTVYAVKRLPPPLPPSNPTTPPSSRSFKGSTQIKTSISSPKSKTSSIQGHSSSGHNLTDSNTSSVVATRSKTTSGGVKVLTPSSRSSSSSTSPQINASSSSSSLKEDSLTKNYQAGSSSSSASSSTSGSGSHTSSRKVVLVPCPKCGKRVKQTSLKVHMKRTHLEEGTVLVCPICSKRISSKGVYYKHMYIHRKRSETVAAKSPATASSLIKPETQGT